jgi:serine/threonine protein kinase
MGSFQLAKRWSSTSLTDAWAGTTVTGRTVMAHVRREPWSKASSFSSRYAPLARGWQGLRHPGIIPLIEAGTANGTVWVVEEFVEGESLRKVMNAALHAKTPLSPLEAIGVAVQLAQGLTVLQRLAPALHHGDLCGSSAVASVDGEVGLGLIGVATALDPDSTLGPPRAELFSIAPEELEGPSTSCSDVFRLGLIALELLTSRTVFAGTSHQEVKHRVEKYPGLLPKHLRAFPQAIAELLASMLAKTPESRPSCSEVENEMRSLYAALGGESPPATVAGVFKRLFPGREPLMKRIEGSETLQLAPLVLPQRPSSPTAVGQSNADGAVTLAKMTPKRMSTGQMQAIKLQEAVSAAKNAAADWNARHLNDSNNPRDFLIGPLLIERQRLTVEQADAALAHAHSFGSTFFAALCFLNLVDEDEGLLVVAEVFKQRVLTGAQLLELELRPLAVHLPRHLADNWHVLPIKFEAGGLVVATADTGQLHILDEVKRVAKVRSVIAVRATERTILEGLARMYEGKTELPAWASPKEPQVEFLAPAPTSPPVPIAHAFEGFAFELPPPPAARMTPLASPGAGRSNAALAAPPFLRPMPSPASTAAAPLRAAPLPEPLPSPLALRAVPSAPITRPAAVASQSPRPSAPSPGRPLNAPFAKPLPPAPSPSPPIPDGNKALDLTGRMFDAVFSLVGERGAEASKMLGFARAVAKHSGGLDVPLDQVRLGAQALVVAALIEGRRAFETPSLPAVSAVLGPHFQELEPLLRPILDGDETLPSDPRAVILAFCFELVAQKGTVPDSLSAAESTLHSLRGKYPAFAIVAGELALTRT